MNNYKISVVVPVYNVEKYLRRCLDAIVNQTYTNLEIVLVDDGAKDSSGAICDEYAQMDSRIKVIHKENAGAGLARNTALDVITGNYVTFVDADDYMELNMYELMMNQAEKEDADLVICGAVFKKANDGIRRVNANPFVGKSVFRNEEVQDVMLNMLEMVEFTSVKSEYPIDMALWKGLFSRKIIEQNKLRLCSERTHKSEDFIFYTDYVPKCKCIAFVDENLYYHCDNEDSISHNYSVKVQMLNEAMYQRLVASIQGNKLSEKFILGATKVFLEATYIVVLDEMRNHPERKYREIRDNLKYVCCNKVFEKEASHIKLFKSEWKKYMIMLLMKKKWYFFIYVLIKLQLSLK